MGRRGKGGEEHRKEYEWRVGNDGRGWEGMKEGVGRKGSREKGELGRLGLGRRGLGGEKCRMEGV